MQLVLDIETIPLDKERLDEYKEKFEATSKKKNKRSSKGGLHFLTGRLVCAGVKPVGAMECTFADEEEAVIIEGLVGYLRECRIDQLITFNGKLFDLPFIRLRAALYGYDITNYLPFERYSKQHYDIYEQLGGKWGLNCSLAEYAWHFGLDTIVDHGSDIAKMYKKNDWDGIVQHNVGDLITTEALYKKLVR
jgi:uncharacterized protein YprB with RNaseH-like and TPR domain